MISSFQKFCFGQMGVSAIIGLLSTASTVCAGDLKTWTRESWQSPTLTERSRGLDITVATGSGGVYFRRTLDASKRYQVTANGQGEPLTMRLQLDDRPHEYLAAPIGSTDRIITGATRLEVLFYSDKPSSYALEQLDINECPTCKTAEDLRERILYEAPEVGTTTGLDKAIALMKWAANIADYTSIPKLIPGDFESWSAEKAVYDFFDKDVGGVSCGGHAVFLQRILHMFDVDAFTINYGVPGSYVTHVSVVVPHEGRFYLFDPSFALTFGMHGRAAPIDEVLRAISAGRGNDVAMREHGLERRDFVLPSENKNLYICDAMRSRPDGVEICKIGGKSQIGNFARENAESWREAGVPFDDAALFRLMLKGFFGIGPSLQPANREMFVALLSELKIPMHAQ